jgi:4-amino-4-deoxychorismate lyase
MDFALIETLRWDPVEGFLRLDMHAARMAASAREFGFAFDRRVFDANLAAAVSPVVPLRVRAELARDGTLSVTTAPLNLQDADTVWRLAIAKKTRLDSADALLRHKTTRRDAYNAARGEYAASVAEDVLVMNEKGQLCDGTITNLFVRMAPGEPLLTPRMECGLLPGVLRQDLLETDIAMEATLTPVELDTAHEIYAGNSMRGLIQARLVTR